MNKNRQTEFANLTESPMCNGAGLIIHRKIEILEINETLAEMFGYQYDQLTGNGITVLDLIEAKSRGIVLRNTLVKYHQPYDAVGLRQDGSTFPIKILDQSTVGQDASIRTMIITAISGQKLAEETVESLQGNRQSLEEELNRTTTQLRYTNERLQLELYERVKVENELRVRARQQAAVAQLGQEALAGAELPTLFNNALTSVAHILGFPYAAIFELSPNKEKLILQAGQGWPPDLVGRVTVDLQQDNPVSAAVYAGETVIMSGPESEACFKQSSLFNKNELNSGLNLPIQGYGVLGIYTTAHQTFTEENLHFLQAVANILAVAIERRQAEEQIRASMQEKEMLLREIHHRVRNNLQLILSLLSLQSGYLAQTEPDRLLQTIQGRVQSMALVHEKLCRSENLAQIDFGEYLSDLVTPLFKTHRAVARQINLDMHTNQIFLTMDTALPCGLIINELVTNALSHAFPNGQGGEIRVGFTRNDDGRVKMSVADDGIGLPAGLDFRESDFLGLNIVDSLVAQLAGTIELQPGPGTAFKITFSSDQ